jgi:hypothetical protein
MTKLPNDMKLTCEVPNKDQNVVKILSPKKICKNSNDKVERNAGKNTNRCAFCNKKLGLFGIKCKCDGLFCSAHRYAECHDCPFDYKGASKESLSNLNPLVIPQKIDQI